MHCGFVAKYASSQSWLDGNVGIPWLTIVQSSVVCLFVVSVGRKRVRDSGPQWFDKTILHWVVEALSVQSSAVQLPCDFTNRTSHRTVRFSRPGANQVLFMTLRVDDGNQENRRT